MTRHLGNSYTEELRLEIKAQAPGRTHGLVTGLPREETIRPPDAPGFLDHCYLPDGTKLVGGTIFNAYISKHGVMQFVFRRMNMFDRQITAWGPVHGRINDGWHTLRVSDIVLASSRAA